MSSDSSMDATGVRTRFPVDVVYQAARMYYLEAATQAEIAVRLHLSRATVSRVIAESRRSGMVTIQVADPFRGETAALSRQLRSVLALVSVHLAPVSHAATLGADLSAAVASAVAEMGLAPGDAVLMSSGRTVYDIAHSGMPRLRGVQLVPAVGGQADPTPWFQTNEITRVAAERSGAVPAFLFAQASPSAAMRSSLDEDSAFRHVIELWSRAKGAILGIGAPPLERESLTRGIPVEDAALDRAAGDVCLNFYDLDGNAVGFAGSDRMVRIERDLLRAVPHAVGVAVGATKVHSIIGAVRAGLVDRLVTDVATARALLAALGSAAPPDGGNRTDR